MPQCQTIMSDGETRCPEPATHRVEGLRDNRWSGIHCPDHTRSMVTNYDHQGGCIVLVLT